MTNALAHYLIIDWGTTNFRALAMDESHQLLEKIERPMGLLQIEDGNFSARLHMLLREWRTDYQSLPIFMAGMVGSAKGWYNVDYVPTQATASDLWKERFVFELPWKAAATILPGVSHKIASHQFDVMRGEEIQVLGLLQLTQKTSLTAILPGTHSKHVLVKESAITSFSSFLTGEFYALLSQHSLLGKGLVQSNVLKPDVFLKGVNEGKKGKLTNTAFLAWTHRLFGQLQDESSLDYLSGLLIGYELSGLTDQTLYFVGSENLTERYRLAAESLGVEAIEVAGEASFIAGMTSLIKEHLSDF